VGWVKTRLGLLERAVGEDYTMGRIRQEMRFRREAIRRYIATRSATLGAVQGSFPAFVGTAHRRLRRAVKDTGIVPFARPDPGAVGTFASVARMLA
jgi:hypothetical protein